MERKVLEKEPESKIQIRFPDCDPFNHLNNSRYIDYFINAREDHLADHYGLDVYKMARETGISWVVSQTQVAYLSSAELMETVTIQTKLIAFSSKHLLAEAVMWNKDKTQVKAIMWVRFVHFNLRTKKSHLHSEELMRLFNDIVCPLPREMDFEERTGSFKPQ